MTTTFKDRSWDERFKALGDEAEGEFESRYTFWSRFGFDRPKISMGKLPKHMCYAPDYWWEEPALGLFKPIMVEVQGCGKDQFFKFKDDKLLALLRWQVFAETEVYLWLWDGFNKQEFLVRLDRIREWALAPGKFGGEAGSFPEGKTFVKFPVETFITEGFRVQ